jgi:DNA polymerase III sliding clamp (beta) subunit (PCNA family)
MIHNRVMGGLAFNLERHHPMNTEITLPVAEWKHALTGLNKVIGRRTTLPVLQTVRVTRDGQGCVRLSATNLDTFATYRAETPQAGPAADLLVPAEPLNRTLRRLPTEETLTLLPEAKNRVRLRYPIAGSPVVQSHATLPVAEWPPLPPIQQSAHALPPEFGAAFQQALACASEDSSRIVLNGVCLDVREPNLHYVVGTNASILYAANSFTFALPRPVIIPNTKFLAWADFLAEAGCTLRLEPAAKENEAGWVELETPQWTYLTRETCGNYPNWKQAVPTPNSKWTRLRLNPPALEQVQAVASRLPGEQLFNQPLNLRVTAEGLWLEGRNAEDEAWTRVPIPGIEITGRATSVRLNRRYLLHAARCQFSQLDILDEASPVLFTAPGKRLVVMPIGPDRANAPTSPANTSTPQPSAEAAAPASPSAGQTESPATVERNTMPSETTLTPPRRGNLQPTRVEGNNGNGANGSALSAAVTQIEATKTALRDVILDLNTTLDLLRAAEKEKKASFKEVESVRATLRSLQKVAI